jgi:thiosulfate reductase cytochrome b subunit
MAAIDSSQAITPAKAAKPRREVIYRHRLWVRLAHWLNALCLLVLLMSGLEIFNAHTELYWGAQGFESFPKVLTMHAARTISGRAVGLTTVFGHSFITTGLFGLSPFHGHLANRGFPAWITLPSWQDLATGRRWHFFFAWLFVLNGLGYVLWSLFSRHISKDLVPTWADWRGIGRSILDHALLRHPTGEAAKRYNVLQRLAYLIVMFILLPLMVLTGMTMSPGLDAAFPQLLWVFDGRQSARTIHFCVAGLIVLFFVVHIVEVILAGPLNELRSMITGRYAVPPDHKATDHKATDPHG